MANTKSSKGNPASHRMSNKHHAAHREACWANGQRNKANRRNAQDARETANREGLKADPTYLKPWERSKLARRRARLENGIPGTVTFRGKVYDALKRGEQIFRKHAKSGKYVLQTGAVAESFT